MNHHDIEWVTAGNFCESRWDHFEYINTSSSIVMVVVGLAAYQQVYQCQLIRYASVCYFLNGVFSIFYHATEYYSFGILDVATLLTLLLFLSLHQIEHTWKLKKTVQLILSSSLLSLYILSFPYLVLRGLQPDIEEVERVVFLVLLLGCLFNGIVYTYCKHKALFRRTVLATVCLLFWGVLNFIVEDFLCSPSIRLVPVHAFYHVFVSLSIYHFLVYSVAVETKGTVVGKWLPVVK